MQSHEHCQCRPNIDRKAGSTMSSAFVFQSRLTFHTPKSGGLLVRSHPHPFPVRTTPPSHRVRSLRSLSSYIERSGGSRSLMNVLFTCRSAGLLGAKGRTQPATNAKISPTEKWNKAANQIEKRPPPIRFQQQECSIAASTAARARKRSSARQGRCSAKEERC